MTRVLCLSGDDRSIAYHPAYNLAGARAGYTPVIGVEEPVGGARPGDFQIDFSLPEIHYREAIRAPGRRGRRGPEVVVDDALGRVVRPMQLELRAQVPSGKEEMIPVSVLPPWYWPHHGEARLSVAALAVPGDPDVSKTVIDVLASGEDGSRRSSVERLLQGGATESIPRLIYEYLATEWEISYERPRIELDDWCGTSYQPVRNPAGVLPRDREQRGVGNCLDLSLLFAACLETVGLRPLILFTGDPESAPEHAFVGWWGDRGQRFRPLRDGPGLQKEASTGGLQVLEPTGVCGGDHRMSFLEAVRSAEDKLAGLCHGVDITASRPPLGQVRSVVLAHSPVVQRAVWLAQMFAEERGARSQETAHLLYGLCAVGGKLTSWLLPRGGVDRDAVISIMDKYLPRDEGTMSSVPTWNYQVCLNSARLNAQGRGGAQVEEEDLLWAVLENPSRNVRKIVHAAGGDKPRLLEELSTRVPRYGEHSRVISGSTGAI